MSLLLPGLIASDELASPLMKTVASGTFSRLDSSSINSPSMPLVGRYMVICIVGGRFGGLRSSTRNLLELTSTILTNGSYSFFQRTSTPACARDLVSGSSGSSLSSELREQENESWKKLVAWARSAWKSHGSEIKRKSGLCSLQMLRRSTETRLNPSQFQVKHLNILNLFT